MMRMKLNRASFLKGALLAAWVVATLPAFAEPVTYEAKFGGKMLLNGTSTVHDWEVESKVIGGWMELDSSFPLDPAQANTDFKGSNTVAVNVPVRSLKSGKKLMDDIMHDALRVKDHQTIRYRLEAISFANAERKAGEPLEFNTKGELEVGGVKKPIEMVVKLEPMENDLVKAIGVTQVKMSDFGISPPAPAVGLGLIKTADEVKISFEWLVAKKKAAK